MSEIDLIPPRYKRRMQLRRWLVRAGVVYGVVACSMFGVRSALSHQVGEQKRQIENLQFEQQRIELEQRRVQELETQKEGLARRLAVLEGLRGGVAAKGMFAVIDRALGPDVWFRSWAFRRAGEIVNEEPGTVRTGYFIVLPKESENEPPRAWRFETHMEITAEAHDHSALASFVRQLAEQPEIESARILNTRIRRQVDGDRVEFELAITVRSTG